MLRLHTTALHNKQGFFCPLSRGFIKKVRQEMKKTCLAAEIAFDDWKRKKGARFSTLHFEPQLGPVAV